MTTGGNGGVLKGANDPAAACQSAPQTGSATNGTPWPQERLNFREAWPTSDGTGVRVAVIDSGVDSSQPQMSKIKYLDPRNVVTGSTDVRDCVDHGTGVTGIIAAPPESDTSFVGVAPGATIIPIRQTNSDGNGSTVGIANGIRWAVGHGAQVINISGGGSSPDADVENAIEYADRHKVVIVCSSGNDGATTSVKARFYPAAYATTHDNVLAVAAVDQSDVVADFSELGGYTTLAAPGVDVIMPALRSGYRSDKGTSFAAPFVTGTVALMLGADPGLTPQQVRARLIGTADPPPKTAPDPKYGYGIVNPYRAVTALTAPDTSASRSAAPALRPLAAPVPPDRTTQHLALGLSAGLLVLAGFILGAWSLARRRRAALHVLVGSGDRPEILGPV